MTFFYLFFVFTLHVITLASASEEWCYEIQAVSGHGCKGPKEWKEIDSCGKEKQSPINIVTKNAHHKSDLKPFSFKGYDKEIECKLTNNGHSAKLEFPSSNEMTISGGGLSTSYIASQLHFHWGSEETEGSEHSIDGEKYPIELHIVHNKKTSGKSEPSGSASDGASASGDIAVLGFFLEATSTNNPKYQNLVDALVKIVSTGATTTISNIVLQDLIPKAEDLELFYRYEGSLTTPPCDETVTWTVFPNTIKLGNDQISLFYTKLNYSSSLVMKENFRPIQKLGNRDVFTSGAEAALSHSKLLLVSLITFSVILIS